MCLLLPLKHTVALTNPGHTCRGIPIPNIHLVNWRKMVIEIKITSHVPSKAREAY